MDSPSANKKYGGIELPWLNEEIPYTYSVGQRCAIFGVETEVNHRGEGEEAMKSTACPAFSPILAFSKANTA